MTSTNLATTQSNVNNARDPLSKLQWNKQAGHTQCHYERVTKMSSRCSLAVAFHFIQPCELYVNVNIASLYHNGAEAMAI